MKQFLAAAKRGCRRLLFGNRDGIGEQSIVGRPVPVAFPHAVTWIGASSRCRCAEAITATTTASETKSPGGNDGPLIPSPRRGCSGFRPGASNEFQIRIFYPNDAVDKAIAIYSKLLQVALPSTQKWTQGPRPFPRRRDRQRGKRESPRAQAGTSCGIGETRTGTTAKAHLPEREHSDGFQYGHGCVTFLTRARVCLGSSSQAR
jgi:hypothetical protein